MKYKVEILTHHWFDGWKRSETPYLNGMWHGLIKYLNQDGSTWFFSPCKNGFRNGIRVEFLYK